MEKEKTELKVNSISLPERCEICHQDDLFDPVNNFCARCCGIEPREHVASQLEPAALTVQIHKDNSNESSDTKLRQMYKLLAVAILALIISALVGDAGTFVGIVVLSVYCLIIIMLRKKS